MSLVIGLTGPTGAGKSSAAKKARELGFNVVDCDLLSRKATEKGSEGLKALVTAFGEEILNDDETLNRRYLAKIAFREREKTELLNKTIFPFIIEIIKKEMIGEKILLDAPTLFESGIDSMCDKTIAVLANKYTRRDRILDRDDLKLSEAIRRINAGKEDDFYKENADYIIYNDNSEEEFIKEFCEIIMLCSKI